MSDQRDAFDLAPPADHPRAPQLRWPETPFRELSIVGRGGMGSVYCALDRRTERRVALKLLDHRDEAKTIRFLREAHLAARLSHPNVVKVHELFSSGGVEVLVSEFVPQARTLEAAWEDLALEARVEQLRDAASGVAAAHALGIVHRDLKPENILVDSEGRVRVTDFGIAYGDDLGRLTQSGAIMGTPSFMAPEQLGASRGTPPTPRNDVWSLGAILYLALTGELAFSGATLAHLAATLTLGFAAPHRRALAGAPLPLARLVEASLQVDPGLRPADAGAFAASLQEWLENPNSSGPARRRPRLWAGLLLLAALAGAGGVLATQPTDSPLSPEATLQELRPQLDRPDRLRAGLAALLSGTPAQGLRLLSRVRPPPTVFELSRTRQNLVAAISSSGLNEISMSVRSDLLRLECLSGLLPRAERGRLESKAVAVLTEQVLASERLDVTGLELLEPLARAGGRIEDHRLGLEFATLFLSSGMLRPFSPREQRRWFLLLLALDVPTPNLRQREFRDTLGPLGPPRGESGWAIYVRLQLAPPTPAVLAELQELMFEPRDDSFLAGPHRWSESVVQLSQHAASPRDALALLERALVKDPKCVPALAASASRYADLGERSRVMIAARGCRDAMRTRGYAELRPLRVYYGLVLLGLTQALAKIEAWTQARALLREARKYPGTAGRRATLLRTFPLLAE